MTTGRLATSFASIALLSAWCAGAAAQSPPLSTRPALTDLDRATQDLYRKAQSHLVRVQVPVRVNTMHPLIKWRMPFDPKLRDLLEGARSPDGSQRLSIEPATTQSSGGQSSGGHSSGGQATTNPSTDGATDPHNPPPVVVIHVECAGIVLNDRGDVLLPIYIDRGYVKHLQVTLDDRSVAKATVSAVDRKTGLTIVRLDAPAGVPASFAKHRPEPGALLMMLAQTRRSARLGVWTGEQADNAIMVNPAGEFAGIVRNGHAMYPSTFLPIVEQLLTTGTVRRATLGVEICDVASADPQRAQVSALGARSAVLVKGVLSDSAAARGGIQPGDMILSLASEPVGDVATFAGAIANRRGRTELLVLREGIEKRVTVELTPE